MIHKTMMTVMKDEVVRFMAAELANQGSLDPGHYLVQRQSWTVARLGEIGDELEMWGARAHWNYKNFNISMAVHPKTARVARIAWTEEPPKFTSSVPLLPKDYGVWS